MEQKLREALAAYGMEDAEAQLLRHNENATYHVAHAGMEYVLRIHVPRPGFALAMFGIDRHVRGKLEGEMAMLRALGEGGFTVQRPVRNREGADVTVLADGDCATLLTWLIGDPVDEVTEEIAREAGRLAARMRLFFEKQQDLMGIDRYAYDEALVERLRELLFEGVAEGAFGDGMGDMTSALDAISVHMMELRERSGEYGLIHADLSKGNLIMTADGLAPIDFCLSGYGFYAQDIAGIVANFGDMWTEAVFAGYAEATGNAVDAHSVDHFVALGVLLFICSQWKGLRGENWFEEALVRWRKQLFRPLFA